MLKPCACQTMGKTSGQKSHGFLISWLNYIRNHHFVDDSRVQKHFVSELLAKKPSVLAIHFMLLELGIRNCIDKCGYNL